MLITNNTSTTIYVETIFPYRSIGIELQSLAAGDTDDFKIQSYIRIFSEIGSCLGINYFGEQIKDIRNFGNLILEEGPRKKSGISIIVKEK